MKQEGKIRIIGGVWKRTSLPVLDSEGLRPTGDRQREMIFNWLSHLLDGDFSGKRSLDMFAGTGALSFEFVSRGADHAVLVEKNRRAAKSIEQTAQKLQTDAIEVHCEDALKTDLSELQQKFDVVFIDPPFALNIQQKAIVKALPFLNDAGFIYVEGAEELDDEALRKLGLVAVKRAKTGASHLLIATKGE